MKAKADYIITLDGHEYVVRHIPEGNQWVPWVFFIYKWHDGSPIGTNGQGYKTKRSAIAAVKVWHTAFHWDGWLNPAGKFFPVSHGQHSLIVDLNCSDVAKGDYATLLKRGWLLMRHGDFPTEWNYDVEVTTKQYDWIEARCKKYDKPTPEILMPQIKTQND